MTLLGGVRGPLELVSEELVGESEYKGEDILAASLSVLALKQGTEEKRGGNVE